VSVLLCARHAVLVRVRVPFGGNGAQLLLALVHEHDEFDRLARLLGSLVVSMRVSFILAMGFMRAVAGLIAVGMSVRVTMRK